MINLICAEPMSASSIVLWVVMIVALVFMLVFPTITQKKRNKEYQQMLQGIHVGDTVRTAGGVIGRVVRITKKGEITTVTLETGSKNEKSYTEFDMNFINCVLKSTRVEETETATETKAEETEKTAEVQENSSDVSDITPENATEEPAKKTRAKSAVKKSAKK